MRSRLVLFYRTHSHKKQAVGVAEAFQKFLPQRIKGIVQDIRAKRLDNREIAYWCRGVKLELVLEQNQGKK